MLCYVILTPVNGAMTVDDGTVPQAMDDAQRLLKTMLGLSTAWLAPEHHGRHPFLCIIYYVYVLYITI